MAESTSLSRRTFLGGLGLAGIAGGAAAARAWLPGPPSIAQAQDHQPDEPMPMTHNMVEGDVDLTANGFDPTTMLTDFDYGTVSTLPSGQTLREYQLVATEKLIEIAPGVTFPAWANITLHAGRSAANHLHQWQQPPALDPFPRHSSPQHRWNVAGAAG